MPLLRRRREQQPVRTDEMTTQPSEDLAVRGYLRVIARWKWLIIAITVACALAGYAYVRTRTPMYSATAELIYVQQAAADSLGQAQVDPNLQQADIGSVPSMVGSDQVSAAAAQRLKNTKTSAGYSVSGLVSSDATTGNYSTVVGIKGVSSDPTLAATVANAYAQAFIDWRLSAAQTQLGQSILAAQSELASDTTAASKTSANYQLLQQLLQNLQLEQKSATGDFSLLSPATAPSKPFAPRKTRTMAEAIVFGLLLGLGVAFLLEQLSTKVRDESQMTDLLGLSVLGHLPPLGRAGAETSVVQALVNPLGPTAEAFRVLRGNLDFMAIDGSLRSLLVSSSIQGEGKSATICNLAVSMALAGKRVVLVDADLRRPRVHTYMTVPNKVGLSSVIAGHASLDEATVAVALDQRAWHEAATPLTGDSRPRKAALRLRFANGSGAASRELASPEKHLWSGSPESLLSDQVLRVVPAGPLPPNPGEMVASQRFAEVLEELVGGADIVLVDSSALLAVGDSAAIAARVGTLLFVVNSAQVKRPMLERAHAQLAKLPCRKLGLAVITAERSAGVYYGYHYHRAPAATAKRGRT